MTLPFVMPDREPFKLPDVRRPEQMPSLPEWIELRANALRTANQRNPTSGKYENMPTLPASLILTDAEKREVQQHVDDLMKLLAYTPRNEPQAEADVLAMVTEFTATFTPGNQSEMTIEARGKAVMDAVEDLPAFAVSASFRKHHRNEWPRDKYGERYLYRFFPPPADIREVATSEMKRVEVRSKLLQQIIRAVPPVE